MAKSGDDQSRTAQFLAVQPLFGVPDEDRAQLLELEIARSLTELWRAVVSGDNDETAHHIEAVRALLFGGFENLLWPVGLRVRSYVDAIGTPYATSDDEVPMSWSAERVANAMGTARRYSNEIVDLVFMLCDQRGEHQVELMAVLLAGDALSRLLEVDADLGVVGPGLSSARHRSDGGEHIDLEDLVDELTRTVTRLLGPKE